MAEVREILKRLPGAVSKEDDELVRKAYNFAEKAHEGQKRYSGDPYFTHVYETALILADLGMGPKTIAAGLLHDTLEDVDSVGEEDIKREFGQEVFNLVEGVTKLGHVRYRGLDRHIESLRKLFVATSEDIRVLIIKLADRLHNMRTLEFVPEEKRLRIAEETMRVYAPIAHRLGMGRIKGQLEDLAFPYIHPKEYAVTKEMYQKRAKESEARLEKVFKRLGKELAKQNIKVAKIDYRRKHLYSLWRKLKRKEMDIERVYDIIAIRVIVPTVSDCYQVLGAIHGLWKPLPGRIKDYIAFPKPNGYKSIHTTIITSDGGVVEIQIRTEEMHREAEFGIASHVGYKAEARNEGRLPLSWVRDFIPLFRNNDAGKEERGEIPRWIKDIAEAQEEVSGSGELMEHFESDFLEDRIFVFTPKGDVIDLPEGSTPVDFAYHIHSDIGDHMASAKVNGKLVSLNLELENGDIVEIVTNENHKPTRKWLDYAQTSLAQRKIRAFLGKATERK